MTPGRRRSSGAKKLRNCARCELPIAEQRPVFLVSTDAGEILGPLHAGCAERIALEQKKQIRPLPPGLKKFGQLVAKIVEAKDTW